MIKLPKGAYLRIRDRSATAVTAREDYTFSRPGLAIVEALTNAALTLEQ